MQKWEYMSIRFQGDGKGHILQFSQNDQAWQKAPNKDQSLIAIMNYYGSQGWELVNADGMVWVFKRPV